MTLNNLKEALILNNTKLLEKMKSLVADVHTHANKDILDKFSQAIDGTLLFDNKQIEGGGGSGGGGSVDVDITGSLDYVNEELGIEDTPIGHIMTYIGTSAPKHYLECDGSEYNISDYPYLANHILKEFGSVNYYGGDGVTTFAVPKIEGTETMFSPQLNESSAYLASASDTYGDDYAAFKAFNCNLEDDNCWLSSNDAVSSDNPSWIEIDFDELKKVKGILIYPSLSNNEHSPKTFTVLGAKSEQDWDTLGEYTDITDWTDEMGNFFEFDNVGHYSTYRIVVSESCSSTYVAIGDIHFLLSEQADFQCVKCEPTYYVVVKSQQEELNVLTEQNALLRKEIEQLKELLKQSVQSGRLIEAVVAPIYAKPKTITAGISNSPVINPVPATIDTEEE